MGSMTRTPAQVAVDRLLRRARAELDQADAQGDERMRFLHAHMAGIRAGAAVVELLPRLRPAGRRRMTSVWEQLAATGEPWDTWAARLGAGASLRAAIEAGRVDALDGEVAEAAVQLADAFLAAVTELAADGAPRTPALAS
jgi:hypothetical protein